MAAPHARRTQRLHQEQQRLGLELGGVVGARTAHRQGMTVSATTVLRQVRQTLLTAHPTPRKVGVDDWAFRKGKTYGTILVDLERHQPVDLLPDRTAETLARWLQEHPGVEVITRDRGKDYIEGANLGAPDAIQVADRFHLLQNAREMLQRLLERHQAALRAAAAAAQTPSNPVESAEAVATPVAEPAQAKAPSPAESPDTMLPIQQTKAAQQREAHRTQRLARYEQVRALESDGVSQRAIARHLRMTPLWPFKRQRRRDRPERRASWREIESCRANAATC
ncbi:MAG: transposase [Caldilineaceae bacterium]